jgi:hypothetical protein
MSLKQRCSNPTSKRDATSSSSDAAGADPAPVVTTDSSPAGSRLRKIVVRSVVGLAMLAFFASM